MNERYTGGVPGEYSKTTILRELLDADGQMYARHRQPLLDAYVQSEVPVGTEYLFGTTGSPFHGEFREIVELEQQGYDVHLSTAMPEHGLEQGDDILSVYVGRDDRQAVCDILQRSSEEMNMEALARYTGVLNIAPPQEVWGIVDRFAEDVANPAMATPNEASGRRLHMLYRAYMTTLVLEHQESSALLSYLPENEDMYPRLHEMGLRPFNIEELYGLVAGRIQLVRQARSVAPPAHTPGTR